VVQAKLDNAVKTLDTVSSRLDALLKKPEYDRNIADEILAGIKDLKNMFPDYTTVHWNKNAIG